ncbi:MAG: glycosyltransferase [Pseudolabrys sp.]
MNDILSARGLADRALMKRLLAAWDRIFNQIEPDLIVGDLAPAASLAARGRIPLLLVGNGYTLPPAAMRRFPPLHRLADPQWNEEETLSAVNDVLREAGRPPLQYLPQLFAADARSVQTFALLDPYDLQRTEPLDGPIFERAAVARIGDGDNIFVYLSGGYPVARTLIPALAVFGGRVHIYAPGMPASGREMLAAARANIHAEPVELAAMLSTSRLAIHTGGSGVAAEALAAGVPQLILSWHIEQDLNGEALQRAGVGRVIRTYDPAVGISPSLIDDLLADRRMLARAEESGHLHRAILADSDPKARWESRCLELLRT